MRLIKLVGDCAMLVAPEPAALIEAALQLIEAAAHDQQLPALRRIAAGPALHRGGDWYGHTVNLANRICGAAPPGAIAVTQSVCETTQHHAWTPLSEVDLKGIDHPVRLFATTHSAWRDS